MPEISSELLTNAVFGFLTIMAAIWAYFKKPKEEGTGRSDIVAGVGIGFVDRTYHEAHLAVLNRIADALENMSDQEKHEMHNEIMEKLKRLPL